MEIGCLCTSACGLDLGLPGQLRTTGVPLTGGRLACAGFWAEFHKMQSAGYHCLIAHPV